MPETRSQRAALRPTRLILSAAAVAAALVAGCGQQSSIDDELSATLIQPVARLELKAQTVAPGSRTGEEIYKSICASCHDAGLLAAPKTGDAAAWAPRLALGFDGLTQSAIAGKNAMPPRGGGSDLTDTEVARAVAYLANTAGAGYTEPPVEAAE
ncbi:MAG: cytochrome c5 family protein [Thauera phenolivorans]|uniref:Cytochrome c5 family protein n=1 Tax=Thauera phenolivorans TaxID=1792543 RepID=A0A7X7R6L9_9RHOO|nr:c-type cytochrome [Thauera phenolivorans]NLF53215.1 cytochrome c5 family protein [Thauera phenolivorans]